MSWTNGGVAHQGKGSGGLVSRMRDNDRPHASLQERRVDMWEGLHTTFVREAKEAGTAGRPRCRTLFLAGPVRPRIVQQKERHEPGRPWFVSGLRFGV
jgi:hypothetical protein